MKKKLIVIVGPTASGKTALAGHLAGIFNGELINADSRQLYKSMDIGTAKDVSLKTHLIDVTTPDKQITVADFKKMAIKTIASLHKKDKLPILVGGSGLYTKVVVDNLEIPEIPVQSKLRLDLEKKATYELFEELESLDPQTAHVIDHYNRRRLIRALEVVKTTGKSFLEQTKKGPQLYETLQIGLDAPRDTLFENIERRAHQMIEDGLEKEVKKLIKKYGWTPVLSNTIGYKEWRPYMEGNITKEGVINDIIKNTDYLVKKQLTWFGKQEEVKWITDEKKAKKLVKDFLA